MKYTNEERETVCVYDHIDNSWYVYTCVPKHLTKLNKIAMPYWEEKDGDRVTAAKWKLNEKQVRFAMERKISEEQRAAMSERARKRFGS
ncbi:hypothetical protein [Paenibacillus sp. AR247]|uniref:hypothetical protein n=1 Tax=Paenibacillus sp. AR247 TaxID=1631599 RepID=UPI000CF9F23D|nr:hypothetical protein [Paenibacillus sp. AR247]PQP89678.1 hypothetical protein CPT76_16925 [Paenibacillus sp. AR247]